MTYDLIEKYALRFVLTVNQCSILALLCFASVFLLKTAHAQSGWTTPRLLNDSAHFQVLPHFAIGARNEILIALRETPNGVGQVPHIALYKSTNRGASFVRTIVSYTVSPDLGINGPRAFSLDSRGNLYIIWMVFEWDFPYRETLVLSKSTDGGGTFSTLWQNRQYFFKLRRNVLSVDSMNMIHLLWDTTYSNSFNWEILYTRFVGGNWENRLTRIVPKPDAIREGSRYVDMLLSGDTVRLVTNIPSGSASPSVYARSTNGGMTFSPYRLVDSSSTNPRFVLTTRGMGVLYGHYESATLPGSLTIRFLEGSGDSLSIPIGIGPRQVRRDFPAYDFIAYQGRNFIGYDAVEGSAYCKYAMLEGPLLDSALFSFSNYGTALTIDSLGQAYLLGARTSEGLRIYITMKDIVTGFEETEDVKEISVNSLNVSVLPHVSQVKVTFRLRNKLEGSLKLYDILGREILIIRRGSFLEGESEFAFEPKDLSSGVYFVALESELVRLVSKFLLVR